MIEHGIRACVRSIIHQYRLTSRQVCKLHPSITGAAHTAPHISFVVSFYRTSDHWVAFGLSVVSLQVGLGGKKPSLRATWVGACTDRWTCTTACICLMGLLHIYLYPPQCTVLHCKMLLCTTLKLTLKYCTVMHCTVMSLEQPSPPLHVTAAAPISHISTAYRMCLWQWLDTLHSPGT